MRTIIPRGSVGTEAEFARDLIEIYGAAILRIRTNGSAGQRLLHLEANSMAGRTRGRNRPLTTDELVLDQGIFAALAR